MKKYRKREKGITLIALVITIIVLLILAGIAIASLSGENGLLSKAGESKEANRMATAKEKVELAILASWDEKGEFNREQFKKEIENEGGSIIKEEEKTIVVQMDIYQFVVDVEVGKIIDVKTGTIFIECEVTPDESTPAPSRNIKIKASGKNQIIGIKLPNSETWVEASETMFEVTKDGSYTFVIKDSTGKEVEETVTVGNITPTVEIYNPSKGIGSNGFNFARQGPSTLITQYDFDTVYMSAPPSGNGSVYSASATFSETLNYPSYGTVNLNLRSYGVGGIDAYVKIAVRWR